MNHQDDRREIVVNVGFDFIYIGDFVLSSLPPASQTRVIQEIF